MARSPNTSLGRRARRAAATAVAVTAAAAATAIAGAGCGSTDPGEMVGPGCQPAQGVMLPWRTGNSWTYRVNDDGIVSMKETVVGAMEPVAGSGPNMDALAFKVVTHKGAMDQTVSWQVPSGDTVIRYREQTFSASTGALELEEHWDPHKLHVDGTAARRATGASWLEVYQETKLPVGAAPGTNEAHDRWTVLSACDSVTVPAGTFTAIQVQKVSATGGSAKTYWYVPGVGKVKESGGQLEELVNYTLVP
jgi:hypothetical protein